MIVTRWAFNVQNFLNCKQIWKKCLGGIQVEEIERLSEFYHRNSVVSSLVGRLLLRRWAHKCLGIPWKDVVFLRNKHGRPYLLHEALEGSVVYDVNVSHSGDWVVLAGSRGGMVGVDVMEMKYSGGRSIPEFFRLMNRQFTTREWATIRYPPTEALQLETFYRHWCLKESLVKALGVGITLQLQRISFDVNSNLSAIPLTDTVVQIDGGEDRRWRFEECVLTDKYWICTAFFPCMALPADDRLQLLSTEVNETCMNDGSNLSESSSGLFVTLSLEELVDSIEEILSITEDQVDTFMKKPEAPFLR